jgi:hypothetical protein
MEEPAPQSESQESPAAVVCPNCGHGIDPGTVSGTIIECPSCRTEFFLPVEEEVIEAAEPAADADAPVSTDQEISALRIKQFATLRRTAYRTRSYFIIGALGCLWVTIPLVIAIVSNFREQHQWTMWVSLYVTLGLVALIGAFKFAMKAVETQRGIEADIRAREAEELEAAKVEPDLSALSDGTQYAKLLERMTGGSELSTKDSKEHEEESM